jgi:hypothetical protein
MRQIHKLSVVEHEAHEDGLAPPPLLAEAEGSGRPGGVGVEE